MEVTTLTVLVVLTAQVLSLSLAEVTSASFHKVKISKATLLTSRTLREVPPHTALSHFLQCASPCNADPLCELWCHEDLINCMFSDMFVMPNYVETNMDDALACYTKRHKDIATGASINGSRTNASFPKRKAVNLVDGIFDRQDLLQCYMTDHSLDQPWFLLDFGVEVSFRLVKLFSQPSGQIVFVNDIREFEVRVGKEAPGTPGDFRSYNWFGSFPGPATEFSQEVTIEVPAPVTARFLSVQKMMSSTKFQICHLEVY